jgi:hypothetical protein
MVLVCQAMVVEELSSVISIVEVVKPETRSIHGTEPTCGICVLSISTLVDINGACEVVERGKQVVHSDDCDIFEVSRSGPARLLPPLTCRRIHFISLSSPRSFRIW